MNRGVWGYLGMGIAGYGDSGITGTHLLHRYPSTSLPLYPPISLYPFQL